MCNSYVFDSNNTFDIYIYLQLLCSIAVTELATGTPHSVAISVLISMISHRMLMHKKSYCQKFDAELKIICVKFRIF